VPLLSSVVLEACRGKRSQTSRNPKTEVSIQTSILGYIRIEVSVSDIVVFATGPVESQQGFITIVQSGQVVTRRILKPVLRIGTQVAGKD
jgi:hypothetical protein